MKRLTALFMAGGLFLTGIPALFVRAEGENYPVYAAVKNYCDLSGNSFTVTDVRTKETKTFDGSAGRNAVFIYGQFGYTYTDNAVSYFSDIIPSLTGSKPDVFVIEKSDKDESSIKASAEQLDPNRVLSVSKLGAGNDKDVYSKIVGATVGYGISYYTPLIAYVNGGGTVYAYTTGSTSVDEIMDDLVDGGIEDTYRGRTVSPNVEKHTIKEIRQFAKDHPVTFAVPGYSEMPSTSQPYSPGKVNAASLQDGLNMVNQIRYIAGLSHEVTLNDDYSALAQAASLVNALNGGLSHYPAKPSGMDDDLYNLGAEGASHSNLSAGRSDIASTVVYGYMNDGDQSNIDRIGHRRWVLNPTMGKTGFGFVKAENSYYGTYSAMYAFDTSGKKTGTVSMWPAQNAPVEYFGTDYPWSYSTGTAEDIEKVIVTLSNTNTGEVKKFSKASSDGYFNVENNGYGLSGCIIFRPNNVTYEAGNKYHVKIDGLSGGMTVEYDVKFFSINGTEDEEEEVAAGVMFRLYNPNSSEHFYTSNLTERNNLTSLGWKYEGSAWDAPEKSKTPVYRLYNPNAGDHHYTVDAKERNNLVNLGWKDEGIGWYSDDDKKTPLYRLYNPNALGAGAHHYTADVKERDNLKSLGWKDEGIGWYGK